MIFLILILGAIIFLIYGILGMVAELGQEFAKIEILRDIGNQEEEGYVACPYCNAQIPYNQGAIQEVSCTGCGRQVRIESKDGTIRIKGK